MDKKISFKRPRDEAYVQGEKKKLKKLCWTADEDRVLRAAVDKCTPKFTGNGTLLLDGSWNDVATELNNSGFSKGRTSKQCRERWIHNLCPSISKAPWTPKEDAILVKAHQVLGNQWSSIAWHLPGRTENSVKIRFKSIQRAHKKSWSREEDSKLLELHSRFGSNWAEIAELTPGRSKNAVKNRCLLLRRGYVKAINPPGAPDQLLQNPKVLDTIHVNASQSSPKPLIPEPILDDQEVISIPGLDGQEVTAGVQNMTKQLNSPNVEFLKTHEQNCFAQLRLLTHLQARLEEKMHCISSPTSYSELLANTQLQGRLVVANDSFLYKPNASGIGMDLANCAMRKNFSINMLL
mmetsp:Transcript_15371/g.27045  ORF Transcript_15371/g.27045 Transcript_15371/m.27045 type:complete len:350 (+) Transcript_15371:97-1146(+)